MTAACAVLAATLSSPGVGRLVVPPDWMPTNVPPEYIVCGIDESVGLARLTTTSAAAVCSLADGLAERSYAQEIDTHGTNVVRSVLRSIAQLADAPNWPTTRRLACSHELASMARYMSDTGDYGYLHHLMPWCSGWLHDNYAAFTAGGYRDAGSWRTVVAGTNAVAMTDADLADLYLWPTYGMGDPIARNSQVGRGFFVERWDAFGPNTKAAANAIYTNGWQASWAAVSNAHKRAGVIWRDEDAARLDIDPVMADLGTNAWSACLAGARNIATNESRRLDARPVGWMNRMCSQMESWYERGTSPGTYSNRYASVSDVRNYYADFEIPVGTNTLWMTPAWHRTTNRVSVSTYTSRTNDHAFIYMGETDGYFGTDLHQIDTETDLSFSRDKVTGELRDWLLSQGIRVSDLVSTNYMLELSWRLSTGQDAVEVFAADIGGSAPSSEIPGIYEETYLSAANRHSPLVFTLAPTDLQHVRVTATYNCSRASCWSEPYGTNGAAFASQHWANRWNWTNGYIKAMDVWGWDTTLATTNWRGPVDYMETPARWESYDGEMREFAQVRMWKYTARSWPELLQSERLVHQNMLDDLMVWYGFGGGDTLQNFIDSMYYRAFTPPTNDLKIANRGINLNGPDYPFAEETTIWLVFTVDGQNLGVKPGYWENITGIFDWSDDWPITAGTAKAGLSEGYATNWVEDAEARGVSAHRSVIVEIEGDWKNMARGE